jgi:hypothetical protein
LFFVDRIFLPVITHAAELGIAPTGKEAKHNNASQGDQSANASTHG